MEFLRERSRPELSKETMSKTIRLVYILSIAFINDYNDARPHLGSGYATPNDIAQGIVPAIDNRAAPLESATRLKLAQSKPHGVKTKKALGTNG